MSFLSARFSLSSVSALSSLKPTTIALLVCLLAALWIGSGLVGGSDEFPPSRATSVADAAPRVQVTTQYSEPFRRPVLLTGRSEASRRVALRSRLDARVSQIHAEKGARMEEGAPVLDLETEDRAAQVARAQALLDQRKLEYDAARKLTDKGHRARTNLARAQTEYAQAQADLARREADLSFTSVRAPFAGILDEREAELGDYLRDGDMAGVIIDLDPLLIVANIPESEVVALRIGMPAEINLVTGENLQGTVRYISNAADPATRTFRIEIAVANPDHAIAEGLTARIRILSESIDAHQVSAAILTLDDNGIIGVKAVNDRDETEFYPVTVVSTGADGMWLTGLPPVVRLITSGQEFINIGQKVVPIEVGSTPPVSPGQNSPEQHAKE